MAPRNKQDYPALIDEEKDRLRKGESIQAIKADFQSRGIHWRTYQNRRTQAKKAKADVSPAQENTMPEEAVEVLSGQMTIDADTPAEVHYGAVSEFDRLPDGYSKEIQPMRPYSDAEEWALNKSMELYGFIGAIVQDQYGRILDGNQRQRVARLRGLSVPHTITHVRDDAHAMEIARAANAIRRHYTPEQRQELAPILRDQGFSYRAIAEALGVGVATVYRDVFGELRLRQESVIEAEGVPNGTPEPMNTSEPVSSETPDPVIPNRGVPNGTPEPAKKLTKGRDKKSYPAQRPTTIGKGQAERTRERMGERGQPNSSWINVLSQAHRLCSALCRQSDFDAVLEGWGADGRQKAASYLKPLYGDLQELLAGLIRIDERISDAQVSTSHSTEV
jgi:transposase-like protein